MTTTYPISQAYTDGQVLSASNVNQIAGGVNDLAALQLNAQTTGYTLVIGDAAKMVTMTSGSATVVTVPPNSSVAFAIGTQVLIYAGGSGQVSVAGGVGVTVNNPSKLKLNGQYAVACLMKLATDTWVLFGNVTS